jgi:hypothetical protein
MKKDDVKCQKEKKGHGQSQIITLMNGSSNHSAT